MTFVVVVLVACGLSCAGWRGSCTGGSEARRVCMYVMKERRGLIFEEEASLEH